MIGPCSSACALFGFLSTQTPSRGVNRAATHHDAINAIPTTAKIEKVYSPAALRAKPMGTNAAIVTSVPASLGKAVELYAKLAACSFSSPRSSRVTIDSTVIIASSTKQTERDNESA